MGDLHGFVQSRIVGVDALLARPVVVGRDHQGCIRAHRLGVARQLDHLGGAVGAASGDHRGAPGHGLHAQLHHPTVLVVVQGRGLAGGADGSDPVDARRHLPLHERYEGVLVQRAVAERSDQGGDDALEKRLGHR